MLLPKIFKSILVLLLLPLFSFANGEKKILLVSAEATGILQTGGLAHAVAGLATALNQEGFIADIAMPFYLQMNTPANLTYSNQHINVPMDVHHGYAHRSTEYFLVKSPFVNQSQFIFFRETPGHAKPNYFDNRTSDGRKNYGPVETQGEAFGTWSKAVSEYILNQNYDVVILNDWHSALVALYLDMARAAGRPTPKIMLAIHNLAFKGEFPKELMTTLGIPPEYYSVRNGIEFHDHISFLKAGMQKSDLIYTVSPNYAKEIGTAFFGFGLDGLVQRLRSENKLEGILNGIDNAKWDPKNSYHEVVKWTFTSENLVGKSKGKKALQEEFGLPVKKDVPVFIFTSRVTEQKGYAYLTGAIEDFLVKNDAQFIVIGDGEKTYINELIRIQNRFPDRFQYRAFSEHSEKYLNAYGDFFVNAAWFEPSGLNQLFALANGTVPVLSRVGGLADSVVDGETGFLFDIISKGDGKGYDVDLTKESLLTAFERVFEVYKKNPAQIVKMRKAGMNLNNSWNSRVKKEFAKVFTKYFGIASQIPRCENLELGLTY